MLESIQNMNNLFQSFFEDENKHINEIKDRYCEKLAHIPAFIQLMEGFVTSGCKDQEKDKIIRYLNQIDGNVKEVLKLRMPEFLDIECQIGSMLGKFKELDPDLFDFASELSSHNYDKRTHFFDAVYEIIKNAVNAISGKGKISVHLNTICRNNREHIKISISDTGCGIPKDKLESIFYPGTSYWNNSKYTEASRGIGLWKTQYIIQKLDGYIDVESKEEKGTTFVIGVPLPPRHYIHNTFDSQNREIEKQKDKIQAEKDDIEIIKIFISYATEDYEIAKRLYDDLKREGISPWLDKEDLLPGQNQEATIRNKIRESSYFYVLISKNSVSEIGHIQKQQKFALNLFNQFPSNKIFIVPVRLDDTEPIDEELRNLHWADLSDYEKGFKQILKSLKNEPK